jgi:ATP-dependent helicase/DNAse subunit B
MDSGNPAKQIKVFYIPITYRGITEELFKKTISDIRDNDYSKILYLAPTPHKIKDAQRIFHKLTKGAYIPPEMATIKQFSKKLYSVYCDKNVLSSNLTPIVISKLTGRSIGNSVIISNFIEEIKQYRPGTSVDEIRNELNEIFSKLNVPEECARRAIDAIEVFKKYQSVLQMHDLFDENNMLNECSSLIQSHKLKYETLIVDGFYELTPVEEQILKSLIEQSEDVNISAFDINNYPEITGSFNDFINKNFKANFVRVKDNLAPKEPSYYPYPDIDEEVEGIAKHIKNLFISGRIRSLDSVTVAFPKLDTYYDIVQRIFTRYGIPFAFSTSKSISHTKPFLDLISLLESIADDYPRLKFSQFLTSQHFKNLPEILRRWIPKISLNSGIVKGKGSWINIKKILAMQNSKTEMPPDEIETEIKQILKILSQLESIKNNSTYSRFCKILQSTADKLGFCKSEESFQNSLSDVLKELSSADRIIQSGDVATPCRIFDFIEGFKYLLNTTKISLEGNGVRIAGLFEIRGAETEFLYLGGLKDGDLPSMPEMDHILPDNVRTMLGLVNMKRYLNLQRFIFNHMINASKTLHMSYPVIDGDKLFLPSPFLPWKSQISENIPGIFSKADEMIKKGRVPLAASIKEIQQIKNSSIDKKFGKGSYYRVTDIDNYRTCPRKFFVEKLLNLEPSEIKEYEIDAMLLGNIVHKIMEKLIATQFKNETEMAANAKLAIKEVLAEMPLDNYWKNFVEDSFLSVIPQIFKIEEDLKNNGYNFFESEKAEQGEVLKGIKLKGKIDRIDKKDSRVELIDYKTGSTQLNRSDILNKGASLQLFLYAALMKSLGLEVERVGLYSLKDIKITWLPGRTDKKEGTTIDDYIKTSLQFLEETVSKIKNNDFTALPINEQTCRTCNEKPYCPYIQTA